ncbi:MAG: Rhodanese-like protein [uncultured Thiotrichaceae bacterium]|uniref:Rhodanese-like protein n=1 Tax=uncultured Thiotrichaceae bacterium TaxID=298394 RepID=A0A6S6TSF6_9GAMM|nr:MAG: Rhodanese-like protein [uncultured Thiotrichaceae bacterium]
MDQYLTFAQEHPLLVYGFVGLLGLILWVEFGRLTKKYKQVGVNEAVRLINGDGTLCLDVREDKELGDGIISGSRHIPVGQLKDRISELSAYKNKTVLVYCRSGNRSGFACNTLTKQGFEDVYNMSGGVMAWESANYPLSKR